MLLVESGKDVAGRQQPAELVLLTGQERMRGLGVDVSPLGSLHPFVCGFQPMELLRLFIERTLTAGQVA